MTLIEFEFSRHLTVCQMRMNQGRQVLDLVQFSRIQKPNLILLGNMNQMKTGNLVHTVQKRGNINQES